MNTLRVEWVDNEGHVFSRVFGYAYELRNFVQGLQQNGYKYKVSGLWSVK